MAFSIDDSWDNSVAVVRAGNAAFGVYARCGAWVARNISAGHITEPVVPGEVAAAYGSPELTRKLVDAGLWAPVDGGWLVVHYLLRNESAESVRRRRTQASKRAVLTRDPALRHAIRTRDQERCRYCGIRVNWADRKGPQGGTYDRVDPFGSNNYDNLVVACRSCASAKQDRTPDHAGMPLRKPPDLDTTQIRSGSESKSNLVSSRPFTPPKGGRGAASPPFAPHAFTDDGSGNCSRCPLPRTNTKVHRERPNRGDPPHVDH